MAKYTYESQKYIDLSKKKSELIDQDFWPIFGLTKLFYSLFEMPDGAERWLAIVPVSVFTICTVLSDIISAPICGLAHLGVAILNIPKRIKNKLIDKKIAELNAETSAKQFEDNTFSYDAIIQKQEEAAKENDQRYRKKITFKQERKTQQHYNKDGEGKE